jgi:glycosyltransferase involved in cell wall biosynthesis
MEIAFLLPQEGTHPTGGSKVVYEYANGLTKRGHKVHVVHVARLLPGDLPLRSYWRWFDVFRYIPYAIRGNWKPTGWFSLDPSVQLHWIPALSGIFLPKADAYVATWWMTADRLNKIGSLPGKRFYLIQHLETWAGSEEQVMATWKAPLEKIVIARWLRDVGEEIGETSHYIPNGLDFSKFGCDTPPEDRNPKHVGMLLHDRLSWKGSADGLAALEILKQRYADLEAELFGFFERPKTLPAWITYHRLPAQEELRRIYNRAAVFLAPSHLEGWGLPPSEAMTCGAALVATDIGGHREFCVHEDTALLTPAKNPELMAKAAVRLIEDSSLRIRIARSGSEKIRRFTWDAASKSFENVLSMCCGNGRESSLKQRA